MLCPTVLQTRFQTNVCHVYLLQSFNAGFGSVLNEDGEVEMDASVMDGTQLAFGAVAGISTYSRVLI
jgi:hypothetical protein